MKYVFLCTMDKAAAVSLVKKNKRDDYLKMQIKFLSLTTVKIEY